MFDAGKGVKADFKQAMRWYQLAADIDNAQPWALCIHMVKA